MAATTENTRVPHQKEKTFSAYTAAQGKNYSSIRRDYHQTVYKTILDHHTSTGGNVDTILDVGCGPGNATRNFAPQFTHAIGLDPSEGMLATARAENESVLTSASTPILFAQSTAEELGSNLTPPVADSSVDLLTVANAAHWFNMSTFWPTAVRVLKPGGTVALWTSGNITPHPDLPNSAAIGKVMEEYRDKYLKEYLTPGNILARDAYRNLPLPWTIPDPVSEFDEKEFVRKDWEPGNPFFAGEQEVGLDMFEKMLATGSAETRWRQAHPALAGTEQDVVRILRHEIENLLWDAGVRKGQEKLMGSVHGAVLLFKKRAQS